MKDSDKGDIKKEYSEMVATVNTDCYYVPEESHSEGLLIDATELMCHNQNNLQLIPQEAILDIRRAVPINCVSPNEILAKVGYVSHIRQAEFEKIGVSEDRACQDDAKINGRRISSLSKGSNIT